MYFQTWKYSEKPNFLVWKEIVDTMTVEVSFHFCMTKTPVRLAFLCYLHSLFPPTSMVVSISFQLAFTLPFFTSTVAKTALETRWMPSSSLFGSNAHGSHWYSEGTWCDTTWISKLPFHRWPPKQGITKESSNTTSNANSKGWCKKYPSKNGSLRIEAKKLSLLFQRS